MNRVVVAADQFAAEAWTCPLGERGGDFVILRRRATGLRAIVGDVCGHGDEAAGPAVKVWKRLLEDADADLTPGLLASWNRALLPLLDGRFVCLTICDACNNTQRITVANCGNPEVLVRRADGTVECLESQGTVLGIIEPRHWSAPNFVQSWLAPQDRVLCVTDGITEHHNRERELFGIERVSRIIGQVRQTPVRALLRYLHSFSRAARGFADDVTIVLMQQVGAQRTRRLAF